MKGPWRVARARGDGSRERRLYRRRLSRGGSFARRKRERKSNGKNERTMCEKLDKDTGGPPRADSNVCMRYPARAWLVFNGIMLAPARSRFMHNLSESTVKNSFDLKGQAGKGVCPPRTRCCYCRCRLHRKWLPSPRYVRGCVGLVRVAID